MAKEGRDGWVRRRVDEARQGIVENGAWLLTVLTAVAVWGWLRDGDVPAWVVGVVVLGAAIMLAVVATSLLRRIDRLRGELSEARQQKDAAQQRVGELERHLAGRSDEVLPAAPAAQSIVRRIRVLREDLENSAASGTPARGRADYTTSAEEGHLVALIRTLETLVGDNETLAAARNFWIDDDDYTRTLDSAITTLGQLEAIAFEYREPRRSQLLARRSTASHALPARSPAG